MRKTSLVLLVLIGLTVHASEHNVQQKKCLVNAYSPHIKAVDGLIETRQGSLLVWNDNQHKSFKQKLNSPDILDTLSQSYPLLKPISYRPPYNHDPGRFRYDPLLKAVYGGTPREITKNLVNVPWLPYANVRSVRFNQQNGAANALKKVVKDLKRLPPKYHKYIKNIGGTYNYRKIAGTNRLSPHSYGIAIDLNTRYSDYWRYSPKNLTAKTIRYKNRIPQAIVDIFEKNGFVWGGRWYHYDTMHFEYRPEVINCSR